MKYKIVVDKQSRINPSTEKREYEIDIEELRVKGNVYDSLIIRINETYVLRNLKLSEYRVLSVLEEPIIEPLENIDIELFDGDNYIYLIDMEGNRFYAEYLIRNEFNEVFATRKEMNTRINQTMEEIDLTVNQKFTDYSTTEEMNSAINLRANEITSTVSETYITKTASSNNISSAKTEAINSANTSTDNKLKNYSTTTQMNSAINQKANEINLEVEKKVDNEDFTGANIMLAINDDTSSGTINADKIDLNGKEINLTSDNIAINSTNFNVDTNGNMTCNNAEVIGGKIELTGGSEAEPNFSIKNEEKNYFQQLYAIPGYIFLEYHNHLTEKYFTADVGSNETLANMSLQGNNFWVHGYTYDNVGFLGIEQINLPSSQIRKIGGAVSDTTTYLNLQRDNKEINSLINDNVAQIAVKDGTNLTLIQPDGIWTPILTQTSLADKKKNFEKLENALDIVNKVDIYKYNLNNEKDTDKKHIGFVIGNEYNYAEELTSKENDGADIYSLASVCLKAIQEQQEQIESLKAEIQRLKEAQNEVN